MSELDPIFTEQESRTREHLAIWGKSLARVALAYAVLFAPAGDVAHPKKPDTPYAEIIANYDPAVDFGSGDYPDPGKFGNKPAANALRISGPYAEMYDTKGFDIYVNRKAIVADLQPNEVARISVWFAAGENREREFEDTTVFQGADIADADYTSFSEEQRKLLLGYYSGANGSDMGDRNDPKKGWERIGGFTNSKTGPMKIITKKYAFNDDGTVGLIDENSVELDVAPNDECTEIDEPIATEYVLKPAQISEFCRIFGQYDDLIPAGYSVMLDSTKTFYGASDSVNPRDKLIQLTYPYDNGYQVDPIDFQMTTLHEIVHSAYEDLDPKSDTIKNAQEAYDYIVFSSDYALPSDDDRFDYGFEIEKIEKVWGAITESVYIEKVLGKEKSFGHPWDNPSEMTSSIIATIAFFPDEFIAEFKQLNSTQQNAIRVAVGAALDVLGTTHQDPKKVIQKLEDIKSALAYK